MDVHPGLYCACGCGKEIPIYKSHRYKMPKYIRGHNDNGNKRLWDHRLDEIRELYLVEKLNLEEVGKKIGCSGHTIWQILKRHGIKTRPRDPKEIGPKISRSKMGHPVNQETREKLRRAMIGQHHALGCRHPHTEEELAKMRGSNHWCWRGGSSWERYGHDFNGKLKQYIRERDSYLCQFKKCDIPENGRKHSVHHIDYNKRNNRENNLITLCANHHAVTNNGNREYWIEYFQSIQRDRGYSD